MKTLFIYFITLTTTLQAWANDEKYATEATEQIILKMIEAHGGYDQWKKAQTFSFDNIMFSPQLPGSPFWINKVIVETDSRNVYQEWPMHGSKMAYDGEKAWGKDWKIGNPPKFEALFFYYFLNLPWLTQDENVQLGEAKKVTHAGFDKEVYAIEMTFTKKPDVGKTRKDSYKLFIDPQSFLLIGYEYNIGYGHMLDIMRLPEDAELFGPMFRINDSFTTVDGLVYPNRMHTSNVDHTQVYGNHAIINIERDKPFNTDLLKVPEGGVIDQSSENRISSR